MSAGSAQKQPTWLDQFMHWNDLRQGRGSPQPLRNLRGVFVDTRSDVRYRLCHRVPNAWRLMTDDDAPSGVVSDGTTHMAILDGVAVAKTSFGAIDISHILQLNMLHPSGFRFPPHVDEVRSAEREGQQAWIARWSRNPNENRKYRRACAVFDALTGIVVQLTVDEQLWFSFEDVGINSSLPEEAFRWTGPVAANEPVGGAEVVRTQAGYSVLRRVHTPCGYLVEYGPTDVSRHEAWAWRQARAASVTEDHGCSHSPHED